MRLVCVLVFTAAVIVAPAAHAEILINVDKSAQLMTVKRDGVTLYTWPVSTGRRGYSTPSGAYTAFRMEPDHFSKEWDDAPMPYSIFFTKIGHAIHGTNDAKRLGSPASHGCVRLSVANAETLYALVQEEGVLKTKVVLSGSEEVALARHGAGGRQNEVAREQRLAPDPYGAYGRDREYVTPYDPGFARDRRLAEPRAQYPRPDYRESYQARRGYDYYGPQPYGEPPPRQAPYGYPAYPPYGTRVD